MTTQNGAPKHIEVTETLVRLYVFLANYLDRCLNDAARQTYPETQLQRHLANKAVKTKVEKEGNRIVGPGTACLSRGTKGTMADDVKAAREVLKNKTIALSDLLAVFRST